MRYMTIIVGALAALVFGITAIGLIGPERKMLPTKQSSDRAPKQAKIAGPPKLVQLRRCSYDDTTWTIFHRPPNMVFDISADNRQVRIQSKNQNGQWVDSNDQSLTARWFRICARTLSSTHSDDDTDQKWLALNWKAVGK